jgi:hypothetical protein
MRVLANAQRERVNIYTSRGERVPLHGVGRGRSAFLLLSGPSLAKMDLSPLQQRGIVTMGVNNSPAVWKPNFWTCVDNPGNFIEQIWKDASICKFAPLSHAFLKIRTRNEAGELIPSAFRVDDCPNVFYYTRHGRFDSETWLTDENFNWGNDEGATDALGVKGSRSVMLVAIKLLWYLGFARIFLLGADFRMQDGAQNYAFPQDRTPSSVKGNNATYNALNKRFAALQPHFLRAGLEVVNCTPESGLTAFPMGDFELAVKVAAKECNEKPINTEGHYDKR